MGVTVGKSVGVSSIVCGVGLFVGEGIVVGVKVGVSSTATLAPGSDPLQAARMAIISNP
jgi:hypothetical protein